MAISKIQIPGTAASETQGRAAQQLGQGLLDIETCISQAAGGYKYTVDRRNRAAAGNC